MDKCCFVCLLLSPAHSSLVFSAFKLIIQVKQRLNEYLMSRFHLAPGAFSQSQLSKRGLPQTASKKPKQNIEPNRRVQNTASKHILTDCKDNHKQPREPVKEAKENKDTTARSVSRVKGEELQNEINKLKMQNRRLRESLREAEKSIKGNGEQMLQYQMYVQELQETSALEKEKFRNQLTSMKNKLMKLIDVEKENVQLRQRLSETEGNQKDESRKIQRYQYLLHEAIAFMMTSFSQVTILGRSNDDGHRLAISTLSKAYARIFQLFNPLIEQWGIEDRLNCQQQHTKPQPKILSEIEQVELQNCCFQDTFDMKEQDTSALSTGKSREGHVDIDLWSTKYEQQTEAMIAKDYSSTQQNHLNLKKGDRVKILKQSKTGMWIGEFDDKIGYFPCDHLM